MLSPRAALAISSLASVLVLAPRANESHAHQPPPPGQAIPDDLRDLPLTEVRASVPATGTLALVITGDGGWAPLVRDVSARLVARGIDVVGLDARRYLSSPKSPDRAAHDAARILRHYREAWGDHRFVLVGYSRGADMLPFILRRLPVEFRARVDLTAMFGLAPVASFEFHLIDLVKDVKRPTDLPVLPELEQVRGARLLCVYGREEKESGCRDADPSLVERVMREGKHHFDGDHAALAELVLSRLEPREPELH